MHEKRRLIELINSMLERNNIIIMIFKYHIVTYAVISENTITLRV